MLTLASPLGILSRNYLARWSRSYRLSVFIVLGWTKHWIMCTVLFWYLVCTNSAPVYLRFPQVGYPTGATPSKAKSLG